MRSSREEKPASILSLEDILKKYRAVIDKKILKLDEQKSSDSSVLLNKSHKLAALYPVRNVMRSSDKLEERAFFDIVDRALNDAKKIPHIRDDKSSKSAFTRITLMARQKFSGNSNSDTVKLLTDIRKDLINNFPEIAAYAQEKEKAADERKKYDRP